MKKSFIIIAWVVVACLAVNLRIEGLYRGLATEGIYHPDEPKQVVALWRYLNDKYLWHVGSLFYDGYPYGLNHVDEWVLRPVVWAHKAVIRNVAPDRVVEKVPDVSDLFYLARSMRAVYSVLAILLCLFVARQLLFSGTAIWYTALLMGLAPVSIAVAHFATGDVGTDLFGSLALLFLCLYSRKHQGSWLFFSGMAVGMAFSCKYNGLLAGGAAGVYLVLNLILTRDWKWFLKVCAWLFAGIGVGIVVLTPALVLDWGRTSSDISANFQFIREYGSGEWWYEKSAFEKVAHILTVNLPLIAGSLGWCVVAAAVAAVIVTGREVWNAVDGNVEQEKSRRAILDFSIFLYPFAAIAVSLAGKPEVQPFHFSYLQIPLVLGAVYGISYLRCKAVGPVIKFAVLCFAIAGAIELGLTAKQDSFFWTKTDNTFIEHQASSIVFTDKGRNIGKNSFVRNIFLEPENASVFRNRQSELYLSGGEFWRELKTAPVPSIPYPAGSDWIFASGPVFPRNERMFKVKRDGSEEKHIVYYDQPESISIGVRSGSWPVEVIVEVGEVKTSVQLSPNSQRLLSITPEKWRTAKVKEHDVYLVPLEVEALVGDAYITVCVQSNDIAAFMLFGGNADVGSIVLPEGFLPEKVVAEVERTRYIEDNDALQFELDADDDDAAESIFPPRQQHEPLSLPLPCGRYVFECEVLVLSAEAEVEMMIDDARRIEGMKQGEKKLELHEGYNMLRYSFSKPFAPYQCCVVMTCLKGRIKAGNWSVRPDAGAMLKDFAVWGETAKVPEWLRAGGAGQMPGERADIVFGDALRITKLEFPAELEGNEFVSVLCGMELTKYPFRDFGEYFVFVHLLDKNGKQVFASGFPVARAAINGVQGVVIDCGSSDGLLAGEYSVEMGVWNGRTRKRLNVSCTAEGGEKSVKVYKDKIRVGKILKK